jgi:N-acetylneuraminic acid mutarotase
LNEFTGKRRDDKLTVKATGKLFIFASNDQTIAKSSFVNSPDNPDDRPKTA